MNLFQGFRKKPVPQTVTIVTELSLKGYEEGKVETPFVNILSDE